MKKIITSIIIVLVAFLSVSVYAASSGTVNTNSLNLRSGAGTNFNSIAKLNNRDKVTILAEEGDWYKVEANGKEGYVSKKYVTKNSDETSTEDSSEGTSNKTKLTNNSTLYVLPLLNSTKLDELKSGDEVILVSVNGMWAYVYAGNNSGWLFTKNLESTEIKIGSVSTASAETVSENTAVNTTVENKVAESTNTTATTNSANTTAASNTTEVANTVSTNTNTTNTVSNAQVADKSNVKYPVIMYVNVNAANVRSSADASSSIVTSVGKNTSVRVLSLEGDWYKVETAGGGGYMKSSLLSLSKN